MAPLLQLSFLLSLLLSLTLISTYFTPLHAHGHAGLFSQQSNIMLPTHKPCTEEKLTHFHDGQELSSKTVGRAQGLFGLASLHDHVLVMLINFVFSEGEYAGSTLSMVGRDPVQDNVREMPIVGGTGVFRLARGYAIAKSLWDISTSEHFVVEYHVTLSHASV
ncbi:hypothetical protein RIF29_05257 [Crotalaria pallida]|uniref:Dirigent protein n=1 Tax=Crotalaria pallida TaxID=3830 RepID=A0AAN9P9N9_CROPI